MKILEIEGLTKYYGSTRVLNNISFNIEDGEIVGLVGPNGAGKTTTIKAIASLIFYNAGTINICGYNLAKEREKALAKISSIIESPAFYGNLSGIEHLNFIKDLRKVSKTSLDNIIEFIELKDALKKKVRKYSLGMKQRLALGMALLSGPKLLILDEPTNGLDPSGILDLREFLIKTAREQKLSILISSHNLEELDKLCDRTVFIKKGEIISELKHEEVLDYEEYCFATDKADAIGDVLSKLPYVIHHSINTNVVYVQIAKNQLGELITVLLQNNMKFTNLQFVKATMEHKYKELYSEVLCNERIS